ncbi:MAG: TonB-dependent siderophore receptor [Burkholderiales bacterium]
MPRSTLRRPVRAGTAPAHGAATLTAAPRASRAAAMPLGAAMLATIAFSPAALAQAAGEKTLPEVKVNDSARNDGYVTDTATVGGGVPQPIRDIPQSVTIINSALMQAQGATSLADALRNVPGITIGAAEGGSIGNNFNLRGFSARTDLYLDGMRDRGQYYRDVFSLDAVEVLQGPSSMLFGRGSTGGIINQVSKLPSLTPIGTASLTVGTQPTVRGTADFNQAMSETSAFRVAAMAQDVHSTRDVMKNQDYGLAPAISFGLGTATEVTFNALLTHNDDMPDYGLPPVNGAPASVDRKNFYGATDDRTRQDVMNLNAIVTHQFSPAIKLRNQTQYSRYRIDARESGPNNVGTLVNGVYTAFPAANTGNITALPLAQLYVGLGSHDRNITDTSLYNQTDLITQFTTGPVSHLLITGLELGQDSNDTQNYTRNLPGNANNYFSAVPLLAPVYAPAGDIPSVTGNRVQSSATDIAPYVNDTMSFGGAWKAIAGVRYDRYNASLTNSINLPASASQSIGFTSVRAGVIWQPTETQAYYASYGTSFNPSLEALTLVNGQQSLDPETSRQYEVGAKWDLLDGNLSLTSALFRIEKDHTRSQISPGFYELTGNIRVDGFQVSVAGRITPAWQVFGGYTYLDARIVSASALDATQGKVPANTPQNSASLWTAYNFTREWQAGTGVAYMSDRYAANNNAVQVPDYFRWDAMVAWQQKQYTIQLNVFNLTNRLNYDALIPSDRGRSVPGTDMQAQLSLIYSFY